MRVLKVLHKIITKSVVTMHKVRCLALTQRCGIVAAGINVNLDRHREKSQSSSLAKTQYEVRRPFVIYG